VIRLLAAVALTLAGAVRVAAAPPSAVVVLTLEGVIGPATADYAVRALASAGQRHAALVVLTVDTPGGLDVSMRDIIRAILASPVPVAAYVAPSGARAASAGTYIVYASHLAVMAPGTNLGAATPIALFDRPPGVPPQQPAGPAGSATPRDTLEAKAVSDAAAYIHSLAQLRGRNADWAEHAVREAASLPVEQAVKENVVDFVADDVPDLLTKADGRTVQVGGGPFVLHTAGLPVLRIDPGWRTQLLALVTNPEIAYLLFLLGIFGIVFELAHPGMAAPGVVGVISLLVGLFGLNFLPIDYAAAGLVLVGVGLMIAEAFVPTYGALGFGGVAAFAIGSLMLFDARPAAFRLSLGVVIATTLAAAAFFGLLLSLLVRARRRPVVTGEAALTGLAGSVLSWSGADGHVLVQGERWRARADAPIAPGDTVRVLGRDGLTLLVGPERAPAKAPREDPR
jgi:membrane-bound serine protease (ClpP class)